MKTYVTCISNERYIPGLFGIAHALSKYRSIYPLLVLVPETSEGLPQKLRSLGYETKVVPEVVIPGLNERQEFYWNFTFFKLAAANLCEYEKIVLLDSDMLIRDNLDFLFGYPNLSATINGAITYPKKRKFSSGVLVLEPSKEFYDSLINMAPTVVKSFLDRNQFVGDEDVYNAYIPNWYDHKELYFHERFNESVESIKDFHRAFKGLKLVVIHYGGPKKPWDWNFIHFAGVLLIKYLLKFNLKGAGYLIEYFFLVKKKNRRNPHRVKETGAP